ncbi:MAG: TetR family transcriptional regulator [Bacillales bacterium]|jgi:hypothetical protein|nr:TetR family transcriptional regulator [Bacillales bacterium]
MTEPHVEEYSERYISIIRIAQKLFMEHGYQAVSTRQIADACEITQPALYHHFKGKKELYLEVIRLTLATTEADINKIIKDNSQVGPRLLKFSKYMFSNFQEDITKMFHDIYHVFEEDKQKLIYGWWSKGFLEPVMKIVEDGLKNGEIKSLSKFDTEPVEIGFLILNTIKASLEPNVIKSLDDTKKEIYIERKSKLIVNVFLNGIGNSLGDELI